MRIKREIGHAPRTEMLGQEAIVMQGPCVGCKDCVGLCQQLIDVMTIPQTVLRQERDP